MNLAAFTQTAVKDEISRRLAMGTVTGTSSNRVVVSIPAIGSVTCPWLRTAGQSGATTLQAQNGDEVVVAGIGEPPSWVILGIVER